MPLWGKTDTANSAPTFLQFANTQPSAAPSRDYGGLPPQVQKDKAVFIDTTEAAVASNRSAGLSTPGWNLYHTYTDAQGNTRRRVEVLVPMKVTAVAAGDAGVTGNTANEDAIAADS